MGFLLMITEIPASIDNNDMIDKELECKLLDIISFNKYILFIIDKQDILIIINEDKNFPI